MYICFLHLLTIFYVILIDKQFVYNVLILKCIIHSLEYVLKMDHASNLTRDATYPPNHETQFDFTLESIYNFLRPVYFQPICPVSSRPHQNCPSWRKCCINPRAKLKYFLCLGEFIASLVRCET